MGLVRALFDRDYQYGEPALLQVLRELYDSGAEGTRLDIFFSEISVKLTGSGTWMKAK